MNQAVKGNVLSFQQCLLLFIAHHLVQWNQNMLCDVHQQFGFCECFHSQCSLHLRETLLAEKNQHATVVRFLDDCWAVHTLFALGVMVFG